MKGKFVFLVGALFLLTLATYSPNLAEAEIAPSAIPIQGKLTDLSGIPLNGTYNITFSLYDLEVGGVALCAEIRSVVVTGGLFSDYLSTCTTGDIKGQKTYLGIKVEADNEMFPRQVIYPVPYARTLIPTGTYVFVPGHAAIIRETALDDTRWDLARGGWVSITNPSAPGIKNIFIPITLPGVLYGHNQRITEIKVDYKCANGANNYITRTHLARQIDADTFQIIFDNTTDRTSNTASSYTITASTNNVLMSGDGIVGLWLELSFFNNTDAITIGGVTVRLINDYD